MAALLRFFKRIYMHRSLVWVMATQELKKRYAGSFIGIFWAIINPVMTILVFWVVFSLGFKIQPVGGVDFIVIFFCGFLPWLTFSETLMANTSAIISNQHLVKKVVFPVEILPLVNIVASAISHFAMLILVGVILQINDIPFSIYNLQVIYYFFALIVFSLALGWLASAISVFFPDTTQIVGVLLNMWFWLTPIVWIETMVPSKYHYLLKLNPAYYFVNGYKATFVYHTPFWADYEWAIYFWGITLSLFIFGGYLFRKLKPEFADVL